MGKRMGREEDGVEMRKEKGKLHRRFPSFSIGTERTTFIDAPSYVGMVVSTF
jgi:hypothetical protein